MSRITLLVGFGLTLLACGCSKSASELLRKGDAAVCATQEVENEVADIVRQQSRIDGGSMLEDSQTLKARLLRSVSLSFEQVTGSADAASSGEATCSGRVKISSVRSADKMSDVSYYVTTDLQNEKPIVRADVSAAAAIVSEIITELAKPDLKTAKEAKAKDDAENAAIYEGAWRARNADYVNAHTKRVLSQGFSGRFTPTEVRDFVRGKMLGRECNDTQDDTERTLICPIWRDYPWKICQDSEYYKHCNSDAEYDEDMKDFLADGSKKPAPLPEGIDPN